jgi:integrase
MSNGHIRQRSPGSFEIRYSLGTDPATGRRKIATTTFRGGRRDAEKELRRLLHGVDTGEHVDPNRMTVRAWLTTWLETVRPTVAPRSHQIYADVVALYLEPAFGAIQLAKLSPARIQQIYNSWDIGGRRDGQLGGLSPVTRRYNHAVLRMALEHAVGMQLIVKNPCDVFRRRLPKRERQEVVVLTSEQSARLLTAAGAFYVPVLLGLAAGVRRGEALGLRWRHADLDRGVIQIVETLEQSKGVQLRFKPPKGDKTRSITLPAFAVAELSQHKRAQAEALLRLGVRQSGETLVCLRDDGTVLTPHALTTGFIKLAKSLGLAGIHFHSLRHSHATALLAAGVHPKVAQERLGHATVAMTLDLYSHVTTSMQEDAAAKIDATFRGKS